MSLTDDQRAFLKAKAMNFYNFCRETIPERDFAVDPALLESEMDSFLEVIPAAGTKMAALSMNSMEAISSILLHKIKGEGRMEALEWLVSNGVDTTAEEADAAIEDLLLRLCNDPFRADKFIRYLRFFGGQWQTEYNRTHTSTT